MLSKALEGVTVVEMGQAVAAPYCATQLAEAGARVIKIERPGGDFARAYDDHLKGASMFFSWLNRGKESIELDIKNPEDVALLHRILDKADVFIQNLAPGAAERAGFGSEKLRTRNPRLITCDITGYGDGGDYAQMRAYDMLVQAESGLAAISGTPEDPGRCGASVCDLACATNAYAGILKALLARANTGLGAGLSLSLFDSMTDWVAVYIAAYDQTKKVMPRSGFSHGLISPYGAFRIGDGTQVVLAVQNQREWGRLCEIVLEMPQLKDHADYKNNPARSAHRAALSDVIEEVFSQLNRETVVDRLRQASIAYGFINEISDMSTHPALSRTDLETECGPVSIVAPPLKVSGEASAVGDVPALGADTQDIRGEFGL
ncbi:MAG: CoA transferase [Rhodobacteraceae bacterium]|nr:CoA transferase [Paracoccaceae bacterium]